MKDFILKHLKLQNTRKFLDINDKPIENKRTTKREYFLPLPSKTIRVSKSMFMSTLYVSKSYTEDAVSRKKDGIYISRDN